MDNKDCPNNRRYVGSVPRRTVSVQHCADVVSDDALHRIMHTVYTMQTEQETRTQETNWQVNYM